MAGNPLIDQGTLNRLRASVVWDAFPQLNVTAPFLGKEALRLALEGAATTNIVTLTGVVTSPEPFMPVSLTMHLLKTQALSDAYKKQMELSTLLGKGTVRPDSRTLSPYLLFNCSIMGVRELDFSGVDAGYAVTVQGYYNVNAALWDL